MQEAEVPEFTQEDAPQVLAPSPQISVRIADRLVMQYGTSLGERDDCVIEEVDEESLARILAAMPAHGFGVTLSADHATITPVDPPADWIAANAAREAEQAALRAAVAAHPDPVVQALAARLGLM